MKQIYSKFYLLFLLCVISSLCLSAQQLSKVVADCTITYSVAIQGPNSKGETVKKLYIKGKKTRSEIKNSSFYQATIFDNKTGDAVILKEIGEDKYMSHFDAEQWKEKNSEWNTVTVQVTNETKKILNYNCRKAIAATKEGKRFVVYYTIDLIASATENPFQFKNIPGLILDYESQNKEGKDIEFKATDVNFSPVPAAKFSIPTSGYRVL